MDDDTTNFEGKLPKGYRIATVTGVEHDKALQKGAEVIFGERGYQLLFGDLSDRPGYGETDSHGILPGGTIEMDSTSAYIEEHWPGGLRNVMVNEDGTDWYSGVLLDSRMNTLPQKPEKEADGRLSMELYCRNRAFTGKMEGDLVTVLQEGLLKRPYLGRLNSLIKEKFGIVATITEKVTVDQLGEVTRKIRVRGKKSGLAGNVIAQELQFVNGKLLYGEREQKESVFATVLDKDLQEI